MDLPLPPRIPHRVMDSRQPLEQLKKSKASLDVARRNLQGPWNTRCDPHAPQWDWRTEQPLGKARKQSECAACWAFAATAAFETSYAVQHGSYVPISEQNVINCASTSSTCTGGLVGDAYKVFMELGAVEAEAEPYLQRREETCKRPSRKMRALAWGYVDDEAVIASTPAIKRALCEYGPIVTAVKITEAMQAYAGGVFNADEKGPVSHALVIIGWDEAKEAWLVRNSWGAEWGVDGYMWIKYQVNSIGTDASWIRAAYSADPPSSR